LLDWYLRKVSVRAYQTAYMYTKQYLERLPIRTIDFTDRADVARHDRMVALVTQMLDLHARHATEPIPHEKAALQRRIDHTDRQIDALVYELYGLTAEEVAIVEAND
nr:restriction endonuclease subunit M [Anaerolineae bacterium]